MGNFNMKFILLTWLCKLGFKSKHCETVIKPGELAKAYVHRQRTAKCETTLNPPMGCSLTWMARWKHCWATSNASCAHGFVSQQLPFYLHDLQNMPNKLWASPLLVLPGKAGGVEAAAYYPAPPHVCCAWGSPVQAPCIPCHPAPEGPVTQLPELWHHFSVFELLLLLRAKTLSQLLLSFWLTWRQCEGWVVLPLLSCPSAPWQRSHLSLLLGWIFRRYLSQFM